MKDKHCCSIDTNILIYVIDQRDVTKHKRAKEIVAECVHAQNCILTTQTIAEFFNASLKKKLLSQEEALAHVKIWQKLFLITSAKSETVNQAITVVIQKKISFWDAMLWATLNDAKVSTLWTEDFQHGARLGNVTFVNPFMKRL